MTVFDSSFRLYYWNELHVDLQAYFDGFLAMMMARFVNIEHSITGTDTFKYLNIFGVPAVHSDYVRDLLRNYIDNYRPMDNTSIVIQGPGWSKYHPRCQTNESAVKLTRSVDFSVPEYEEEEV